MKNAEEGSFVTDEPLYLFLRAQKCKECMKLEYYTISYYTMEAAEPYKVIGNDPDFRYTCNVVQSIQSCKKNHRSLVFASSDESPENDFSYKQMKVRLLRP